MAWKRAKLPENYNYADIVLILTRLFLEKKQFDTKQISGCGIIC